MRIERIEFEAIGPFAGYYDIDLNELGDSALFLIDGPTGAGKSTILDAITFGIYGDTSGSDSDKSRMRSQYAKPTQDSWVRVTFSTANGTYRIRRSPEYTKPSSRGKSGETKVNATAQFQKLDGANVWITEFEQIKDSATAALEAVGLTKAQFAQTVLLPQGEFDKFLKADSKDRQALLSKIFGTELFSRFRDALKARASRIDLELRDLNHKVQQRALVFTNIFTYFDEDIELLEAQALDIARADELFADLDQVKAYQTDLLAKKSEELREARESADHVQTLLQLRKDEAAAKSALDKVKSNANESKAALDFAVVEGNDLAALLELKLDPKMSWQKHSNSLAVSLGELEKLVEVETGFNARVASREEQAAELEIKQTVLSHLEGLSKSLPEEKMELEAEQQNLISLSSGLEKLKAQAEALKATGVTIQKLKELEKNLPKIGKTAQDAAKLALDAEEKRHTLNATKLANMAGVLAAKLEKGKPCEVCGSVDHPDPADISVAFASDAELDEAAAKAEELKEKANSAQEQLTAHSTEIRTLKDNLTVDPAKYTAEKESVTAALAVAETATTRLEVVGANIADLQKRIQENITRMGDIKAEVGILASALALIDKGLADDLKKLQIQALPFDTIVNRYERTRELANTIDKVIAADASWKSNQAATKEREEDFKKLEQHEHFGDVASAETLNEAAKLAFESLKTEVDEIKKSLKDFGPALENLRAEVDKRTALIGGSQQLKNLAKIADGENPFKQPIDTFVLQSMFRQVLVAANVRFNSLLEGRYSFELDETAKGNSKNQGLGLSVLDAKTGSSRSASSLSGGESFCASLSLALGLSDIVRAESGGLSIETFFIDEGFGSLDGERLNQVNNMLSRLQSEGRTIGLISHVADLKESIQEKIDVKASKLEGPSTLKVNWMASGSEG
jgi:exonuclease SbcC